MTDKKVSYDGTQLAVNLHVMYSTPVPTVPTSHHRLLLTHPFQLSECQRAPIGAMAIPANVAVQSPPVLGGVKINPNRAVPLARITAW